MTATTAPQFTTSFLDSIGVEIMSSSHDKPFEMFWNWFRQTWITLQDVPFDHNDPEHIQACLDVINRHALPTPMEVLNFEIKITGLSRVALAQITRGRVGWAYVVESQMPQHINHNVTIPINVYQNEKFRDRAVELVKLSQELYDDMYDAGIPPQDCRYLVMHSQQTSLVMQCNYAALLGYFARRCENGLTDELNLVGRLILRELKKKYLNADGSDQIAGSGWSVLLNKMDGMGTNKVCLNVDKVFGNTGRAPSVNNKIPSLLDNSCDYDFSQSAWYFELQNLPDDLLFPGEREMIEDFKSIGFVGRLQKLADSKKV
jgi:hypothetical protein